MVMDEFAATPPPASHRNSYIIDLGLPSSSVTPIRRRRATVPGKERKKRSKRGRDDADAGGLKPSYLGQNQETEEHELEKEDENLALQKQGKQGQRFLRKCTSNASSEYLDTKTQVPGKISPPCQNGVICRSEKKHDVSRKVVSPYFQKEVAIGYENFVDGNKKEGTQKDKKRRKAKNKHRRKRDEDCLEAHRTVSPYFQAQVASDDQNLELEKEKAKKRKRSKRWKDDEPLGDRDEEQDYCGSNSDRVSPYFEKKNKVAKNLESTWQNCKDNREILVRVGHQLQGGDYNTMRISSMESLPLDRASVQLNLDPFVHLEIERPNANNGCMMQVKRIDAEEKTKSKAKARYIELEQLFSKFCYKEKLGGCAVKQTKASQGLTASEKRAEAYKRRSLDNTWKPPRSPYNLLQEEYSHDPWRVLVICMLLNITTGPQVRRVVESFFVMCPDAQTTIDTQTFEIARVIQSLGLHHKRAAMIQHFSRQYLSDDWTHVTQLHGIGKYAADAYAIFCTGMWDQVKPNDIMLDYYWKFLKKRGLRLYKTIG